jgi:hypothetical protein
MDFTVNDDLSTYSVAEIADLITKGNEALDALFAIENPTREQTSEAARILAAVESLQSEQADRETAVTEMTAMREARETARVEAAAAAEAAAAEAEAGSETDEEREAREAREAEEREAQEAEEREREAVTAGAGAPTPPVRRGGNRPSNEPPAEPAARMTLTAAADVPGFSTGAALADLNDVTTAVLNRARSFPSSPQGIEGAPMSRYGVAMLRREFPENLIASGNNDQEVMDTASREARLEGGSLVAAGGWCAPSQTLYDFCEGETSEGLIDLPEFQVTRGGVRTTPGPDFATLYANTGFTQTEAQAIAGTVKPCYEVVCPAFTETRLDVVGLCIKVPILTNAAYPELVRRVISGSLVAHQHRLSANLITKMVAKATAVTTASVGSGAANTLNAIALIAETLRGEYRLSLNATMEVVLPSWVREMIRADMGIRNGADAALVALADAQINQFFAVRKARVQWVYNWQMLVNGEEGFPATFQMMVYPAGTFVKGTADVISLDAVYDAASLSVNTYTGLFMEEGVLLLQNCFKAKIVTVNACAGGVTGAASNAACFTLT